jgi:hypothetical protein
MHSEHLCVSINVTHHIDYCCEATLFSCEYNLILVGQDLLILQDGKTFNLRSK